MSKTFIIGTCRVYTPSWYLSELGIPFRNIYHYPGEMVHSPRQILQSIDIMKGKKVIDKSDFSNVFRTEKPLERLDQLKVDLSSFDKFIVEISAVNDYYTDKFICHFTGEELTVPFKIREYTLEELMNCISKIHAEFDNKPILFVHYYNHNHLNIKRYMLSYALDSYCLKVKNATHLDLLKFIAEHGLEKTMYDQWHHTDFMIDIVKQEMAKFIKG